MVPDSNYQRKPGVAGETLTAGQGAYLNTSDGKIYKADNNDTAAKATLLGIVLNGASVNQPVEVQTGAGITIGGTVVVGEIYVVSATAGGIAPEGDLVSTNYVSIVGVGITSAKISMGIKNSGVQVP